ncbi:MAG: hypothetical protein AAFR11_05595 [Pseudomonadota bacterium]
MTIETQDGADEALFGDGVVAPEPAEQPATDEPKESAPAEATPDAEQVSPAEEPAEEGGEPSSEPPEEPVQDARHEPAVPWERFDQVNQRYGELKGKFEQLERALAERQQPAQQAPQPPDPIDDPQGYQAYQDNLYQMAERRITQDISKRFAQQSAGDEFGEIEKWALDKNASDPAFRAAMDHSRDPWGDAVTMYRREQIANQVTPDDFAAFQKWKASQGQAAAPAQAQQPAAQPAPAPKIPPSPLNKGGTSRKDPELTQAQVDEQLFG